MNIYFIINKGGNKLKNVWLSLFVVSLFLIGCNRIEDHPEESATNQEEHDRADQDQAQTEAPTEENDESIEQDTKSGSMSFAELIEEFKMLESYDLYHPSYLGEGMDFIYSTNNHYLASGHYTHALGFYRIVKVDDEKKQIIITHEFTEEHDEFYDIHELVVEEQALDRAFDKMVAFNENKGEVFFDYNKALRIPTHNNNEILVYDRKESEERYTFELGVGFVEIFYYDDATIEFYGEEQYATPNPYQADE